MNRDPFHGQGPLPPGQVAPSPIQPGLEHCQGGGSHSFLFECSEQFALQCKRRWASWWPMMGGCTARVQARCCARRALTEAVHLEEALIPFVLQGAANSRWSEDLLARQEEPQRDVLNVYAYRNV